MGEMNGLVRAIFCTAFACLAMMTMALDKSITESYAKIQAAILKKDVAAMKQIWLAYVDPSCEEDRKGKKTSYKKLTDAVEQQMKLIKKVNSCQILVTSSKTKGGNTVCSVETKQSFIVAIEGKDRVFDVVSVVEDSWKKIGGRYKIVGIKAIKETLKQDGKVIQSE